MNQARNKIFLVLIAIAVLGAVTILAFYNRFSFLPVNSSQNNKNVQLISQEIKVRLIINNGSSRLSYDKTLPTGSTVFDLLEQLSQTNNFSLSYQQSQLGVFIEEIAGVKNDNAANKYWLYKVNGKLANVGASGYIMQNNDEVEWYYGVVTDFK